jgi:hypothetical protein
VKPIRQAYLHQSIPSAQRATLVSFDSLVGSLGSIGGSTGLGYLAQARSVPSGFLIGGRSHTAGRADLRRLRALNSPADPHRCRWAATLDGGRFGATRG